MSLSLALIEHLGLNLDVRSERKAIMIQPTGANNKMRVSIPVYFVAHQTIVSPRKPPPGPFQVCSLMC